MGHTSPATRFRRGAGTAINDATSRIERTTGGAEVRAGLRETPALVGLPTTAAGVRCLTITAGDRFGTAVGDPSARSAELGARLGAARAGATSVGATASAGLPPTTIPALHHTPTAVRHAPAIGIRLRTGGRRALATVGRPIAPTLRRRRASTAVEHGAASVGDQPAIGVEPFTRTGLALGRAAAVRTLPATNATVIARPTVEDSPATVRGGAAVGAKGTAGGGKARAVGQRAVPDGVEGGIARRITERIARRIGAVHARIGPRWRVRRLILRRAPGKQERQASDQKQPRNVISHFALHQLHPCAPG